MSELDWDMKPIFYGGIGLLFAYKRLHLDSRFRLYFESNCGVMTDSDWMNITIPGAANSKTNYSESDNSINFGMLFSLTTSWRIDLSLKKVSLYPFAAFEWESLDFRARNGTGIYADANTLASNNGQPKEYSKGELMGIDYKRYTHHVPKGEQTRYYNDRLHEWFTAYRFATGASFLITERTSIIASIAYTFSRELHGDTYSKIGSGEFHKDTASSPKGSNFVLVAAHVAAKVRPLEQILTA